jgi:ABC-type multidrug transport system ATPase subunit
MRLRFVNVALQAGPQTVLAPLSFTLEAGQVGCLYGPARQGKTAALLLAGGYMKGFAGQIWLDQLAVSKEPKAARRMTGLGLIPGLNPLQPRLTVRESLTLEARLQRVPLRERGARVEQALNQFGLAATAGQKTFELTGAQLFRAGLAVAAIHDPSVYLLDDPADLLTTEELLAAWTLLRSLTAAGKSVLIASQSAGVAERADLVIRVGKEVAA